MPLSPPLNFTQWLQDKGHLLQPPVNNFCLYSGKDFTVMVVGGPNERNDYHVNETEVGLHPAFEATSGLIGVLGMVLSV